MKICLTCSLGGHLTEIMQLKAFYSQYDYYYVTEQNEISAELATREKVFFVDLINRQKLNFPVLFIKNFYLSFKYLRREKPNVIISTGALSSFWTLFLGKLMGAKIIFVESFANIETPTLTGKLVYRFADLFVIQWEALLKYYPKAVVGGGIF